MRLLYPQEIHRTVGVYPNGDRVVNHVAHQDILNHIIYNLFARPGRAFFVDGVCFNTGMLSPETIEAIEQELYGQPQPTVVSEKYR